MPTLSLVLTILIGLAILLFGRQLFWLFVGVAGFVLGVALAPIFLPGQDQLIVLIVGLIFGLVGAFLVVVIQEIAIAVAGFIFGAYALSVLLNLFNLNPNQIILIIILIIGGIFGAALVLMIFDPALIGLSSLAGASIVTNAINLEQPLFNLGLFLALLILGIGVQIGAYHRIPVEERQRRRRRRKNTRKA